MKKLYHILSQVLYTNLGDKAWKITQINFTLKWGIVATFEAKKRRRLACSKCGLLAVHKCVGVRNHRALHQILLMGGICLYVMVKQPLIRCAGCHQQSVCRPHWLKAGKRYTEPFRRFIAMLCRVMSCSAVASLCQMTAKTVRAIDIDVLKETTQHIDLSHTRRLMVDEKRIAKNRFVTLVLDGDSHQLLYLGQGRRGDTLRRFLRNLPPQIKRQIEAVAMDGSRAYRKAVESELPYARICLDRFHLSRDLMHMLRLAQEEINASKHGKLQRHVLQRIAMLTSRNDRQAQSLLAELTSAHHINAELMALVTLFKDAWRQSTFRQAAAHLQRFAALAMRSGIKAVQRFARRIARDADYIAHGIDLKLTNGAIESFNRKIADLLRRGYGYRDLEYLSLKIHQLSIPFSSMAKLYTKSI